MSKNLIDAAKASFGAELIKEGSVPILGSFKNILAWTVASGLGGLGVAGVVKALDKTITNIKAERAFGDMVEKFPELKQYEYGKVREAFDMLKVFAPEIAEIPRAAGTFVNRMVNMDNQIHTTDIKDLLSASNEARKKTFRGSMHDMLPTMYKGVGSLPISTAIDESKNFQMPMIGDMNFDLMG